MVHSRPVVPVVGLLTSIGDSDLDSSFEEYSVANVVPIVDPIPSKTIRNKMVHSRPVVPVVGLLTSIGDSDLDSSFGEYSVADMVINNGTPEGKGPGCLDGGLGLIDDNVDVQKKQNPLGYVYKGIQMAAVGGSDDQDGTRDDTQGTGAKRGKHDDTDAGNDGDASINNHVGDSSDADTNSDIFIYDNDSQTNQGVNKTTPSCSSPPYSLLSASLPSRLNARDRDLVLERGMDAVVKNLWQKYGVPEWLIWETWGRNIDLTKTEVELQTARRLKYDKVIETD
jgi:hypothetical protein